MRRHPNHPDNHSRGGRRSSRRMTVVLAPLLGAAALMLTGCNDHSGTPSRSQRAQAEASLRAYAQCMRSHGVADFPSPSTSSAGGIGYSNTQIQAINRNSPSYPAANTACRHLPGAATAELLLKPHS
jgi:hypothetical protein